MLLGSAFSCRVVVVKRRALDRHDGVTRRAAPARTGFTDRRNPISSFLNIISIYAVRGGYIPLPAKTIFLRVVLVVQLRAIDDLIERLLEIDPGGPKVALPSSSSTRSNSQKSTSSSAFSSAMARRRGAIARIGARSPSRQKFLD